MLNVTAAPLGPWLNLRVQVVALCFGLNVLDGADMLIMSFIAPILSEKWGVSPERLGLLFSASLLGMAIGCLLIAPLADRYGRRKLIIAALGVAGLAMLASAYSTNVSQLMFARLFVGIGVGTIGVSMTTMAAEYAPEGYVNFTVAFVQAGWPLGAIVTAFVAADLLPVRGWQSLLLDIGLVSVFLFTMIFLWLPESLSFLARQQPRGALANINRIRGRLGLEVLRELPTRPRSSMALRLPALFDARRKWSSILLWSAVTLGYFVLYFVISWIPKLAVQAGLSLSSAIYAGATYNLGAFIGTTALGWVAIKFALNRVVAWALGLGALALVLFGGLVMPVWLTLTVTLCVGLTVQGGFNGFWALAARLYPAEMRSTGIGWALGVGRIGAVLGPLAGGLLVGAGATLGTTFGIFAAVSLIAAALVLQLRME
jgi:benzoate transport